MSSASSASIEIGERVANHCNALPDKGANRMPAFAMAIRAAYARHGITPGRDAESNLARCTACRTYSGALTVNAVKDGIPEDEVMALTYLIF